MKSTRATLRDVRRDNRRAVLSRLFFEGPLSRPDLTVLTGLSVGTISTVSGELIAEGVVAEAGLVESDGGRPKMMLRVDPDYGYAIGVDVGETRVRIELFDLGLTTRSGIDYLLDSAEAPRPDAVADRVASGCRAVIDDAGVDPSRVLGLGIGVFGTVEQGSEAVVHAQTVGWEGVRLERLIHQRGIDLPIYIDNGVKTLGQAEVWFGAGRGLRHVVVALVGSGVGAALIWNGSLFQGATSSAAEWGHTTLAYGGRLCRCGARGCLEAYVGAGAVLDRYREAGADGRCEAMTGDEEADFRTLLERFVSPDYPAARRVVTDTVGYLGAGFANLINLFNPERIVLGGWAGLALGRHLMPEIHAATTHYALRHLAGQTTVELCEFGPDAVAFGAATLPVAELLAKDVGPRPRMMPSP